MKKILTLLIVFVFAGFISACQQEVTSPVVVSKLYDATSQANNVIELYNNSDVDEDLSDYTIQVFTNGATEPQKTFALSGTIAANSYFEITGSTATDAQVLAASNFAYSEGSLPFNGNDAIAVVKKDTIIDFLGYTGMDISFALDVTLIRIGEVSAFTPSTTYDEFNFITYIPDAFQYLKNETYEIKTLDQLLDGPRLEERYLELPYKDPDNDTLGTGGAVLVTSNGVTDGDTANFNALNGYPGGALRYFYINTPEVDGGSYVSAEPWGYVASKYNKQFLLIDSSQKEIRIQSVPGYSLTESNGRNLGFVWINGYLSQFLIVSEGLTEDVGSSYDAYDLALTYKNVPYLTFLRFAEQRARENGWGLHGYPTNPDGEKSPDWNYQSYSNATHDPVWTPHLALPWA
ncbi:MAG: lamin tail domain-containing protein [Acholeplasmataceae bacterium]